jgi:hypothetical protein
MAGTLFDLAKTFSEVNKVSSAVNDITVRLDPRKSRLKPTSGKKQDEVRKYQKEFMDLNAIKLKYSDILKKYELDYNNAAVYIGQTIYDEVKATSATGTPTDDEVMAHEKFPKMRLAFSDFNLLQDKLKDKVFDPAQLTEYSIKDLEEKVKSDDLVSEQKQVLVSFINDVAPLVAEVEKIKKKILEESRTEQLSDKPTRLNSSENPDKNPKIPERVLDQWVYDIELYYIRPDNEVVKLDPFINEFIYTMEYDLLVMPVFSVLLTLTDLNFKDFKSDFEQLRFFINVKKWERNKLKGKEDYIMKTVVLDNHPLIPINPSLPTDSVVEENPTSGIPRHKVKLDLVSKRNVEINGKVKSKVYNNVTMLDVITALLNEAYNDQKKINSAEKDIVKFAITPPDNVTTYEQVILDPGTIAQNIKQLQEKYGVYRTGIRVMFDTVVSEKDEETGRFSNKTLVTVTDKGGTAPGKNTVEQVLIEILDKVSKTTIPEFEEGSNIDQKSNILIARTMQPYQIDKKNAGKILDGDNVRIIQTSQDDTVFSECDINMDDEATQRTYWGSNDNPYNLTQLQDSIREKQLNVVIQLCNVDIFAFTENMQYVLKFYNKDDELHSGEYRLKAVKFYFTSPQSEGKTGVPMNANMYFTNIPKITVNGAVIQRESYVDKVKRMKQEYAYFRQQSLGVGSARTGSVRTPPIIRRTGDTGPFSCSFSGKNDYNGRSIPQQIPASYPMSANLKLEDCYTTKDGAYPDRGSALCQDFNLFCFAQKFAKVALDPIIAKYGKFVGGGGRMNSFYRYHIPSGGSKSSMHIWAMAADIVPSPGTGDLLCEPFFWLATQSGIPFDQIILEGNGSEWRWIHIGMHYNGQQRGEIRLAMNSMSSSYPKIDRASLTSPSQLAFAKASKLRGGY